MNRSENRNTWTDERKEIAFALWADGLSASEIAKKLGGGVSRNSVIGVIHRAGKSARFKPAKPVRVPAAPVVRVVRRPSNAPAKKALPSQKSVPISAGQSDSRRIDRQMPHAENPAFNARSFGPLPGREPVPFGTKGCRWPVGSEGADMLQCGCDRAGEGPYCASHKAVATVPTTKPHDLARSLRRYTSYGRAAA